MIAALIVQSPAYMPMEKVTYCQVEGKSLTLNAFLPNDVGVVPAIIEIHGGWFVGGGAMTTIPDFVSQRKAAFFSLEYRLGNDGGGFPQCVRDCRNAIRFLRKNAKRFRIDPARFVVMGGSAGGHLSLMVAMVPERFDDGGPTPELKGVSAKVAGAFAWIAPTDFVRFWNQGPDDVIVGSDGTRSFRGLYEGVQNDARPHLRALFHGVAPDDQAGRDLYTRMSPIGHVRKRLPPLLICDGAHDPIVPGTMGRDLHDRLLKAGADSTYWVSDNGHDYPGGPGFDAVLSGFLDRTLRKRN